MKEARHLLVIVGLCTALLLTVSVSAHSGSVLAQSVTDTATPEKTLVVTPSPTLTTTATEELLPPDAAEHTLTPTTPPTLTPTLTPIPRVPETGFPVVIPLLSSGPPEDGYGPEGYPNYINPLTGLVVPDPDGLDRRPVAIKVTNYPRYVRPQAGLSKADIVYEYYMEQGISRFIAVFYGQEAEKVGPVRSGRLFDEHIFRMYDSFFVFGYADVHVIEYFEALETEIVRRFVLENDLDKAKTCGVDPPSRLCRDRQLEGYNTMFADTAAIRRFFDLNYGNNQRPDLGGMYFSDHVTPSQQPAAILKLRYSPSIYNYWEYDPDTGLYLRWQETQGNMDLSIETYLPHYDGLTKARLSASNVVFLVVDHKFHAYTEGTEILGINLTGKGLAYVFRDGFYYPAEWVRPEEGGVLQLFTLEGEPFALKPGQTWFEVVSQYTELDREGSSWSFHFQLPPDTFGSIYVMDPNVSPLEWFYEDQNPGKIMPWNGVIETPKPTPTPTTAADG
ncbi:MAG: DUF3048 domain-containing protein [Anaerolineales bacterium]|nr:DUF3048 domain-containing protein [Anaerolineales bacterium]